MELESILIFVINLISNTIGVQFITGQVQMLQKHPKLQECATLKLMKVGHFESDIHGTTHIGGRVSTSDGMCEGFYQEWELNEAIESDHGSGYAYFKYTSLKETFEPPMIIQNFKECGLPYRLGAKIILTFRTREKLSKNVLIGFAETYVTFRDNRAWFRSMEDSKVVVDTTKKCELSLLIEKLGFMVHVNGVKIGRMPLYWVYAHPAVDFLTFHSNNQEIILYSVDVALYPQ